MIRSFRSKALRHLWEQIFAVAFVPISSSVFLIASLCSTPQQSWAMSNVTGARFHSLRGRSQRYAIWVNKNWRITFGWQDGHSVDVDLEDYH